MIKDSYKRIIFTQGYIPLQAKKYSHEEAEGFLIQYTLLDMRYQTTIIYA